MSNRFDAANAPEAEPSSFVAGDFIQWKRPDVAAVYVPSTGYTAEYIARIDGSVNEFRIAQAAGTTDGFYLFSVGSTDTSGYVAGLYRWQLEITQTSSGNRIVVDRGEFTIQSDMDVDNADGRSHAAVMLQKIESLLAGRADSDTSSYSIAGRSLTKMPFSELLEARNFYKSEVRKEQVASGLASGSTIQVRF